MTSSGRNGRSNQRRRPFNRSRNNNGKNGGNNKPSSKKPEIKKELKFHLHGAGKYKQTATFTKVLTKICIRIQQLYHNGSRVAKSLREGKIDPLKKPERERSDKTDKDEKAFHQETLDMTWDKKVDLRVQQKDEF